MIQSNDCASCTFVPWLDISLTKATTSRPFRGVAHTRPLPTTGFIHFETEQHGSVDRQQDVQSADSHDDVVRTSW